MRLPTYIPLAVIHSNNNKMRAVLRSSYSFEEQI
jgi:hypothetical protein